MKPSYRTHYYCIHCYRNGNKPWHPQDEHIRINNDTTYRCPTCKGRVRTRPQGSSINKKYLTRVGKWFRE